MPVVLPYLCTTVPSPFQQADSPARLAFPHPYCTCIKFIKRVYTINPLFLSLRSPPTASHYISATTVSLFSIYCSSAKGNRMSRLRLPAMHPPRLPEIHSRTVPQRLLSARNTNAAKFNLHVAFALLPLLLQQPSCHPPQQPPHANACRRTPLPPLPPLHPHPRCAANNHQQQHSTTATTGRAHQTTPPLSCAREGETETDRDRARAIIVLLTMCLLIYTL